MSHVVTMSADFLAPSPKYVTSSGFKYAENLLSCGGLNIGLC